ncbi:MAG: polysaccharide deacetylase family protein, partial [Rhodothermales bacterium]
MALLVEIVGTWIPRAASTWFPDVLWRISTTSKTAYLTFDDGPNPSVTERISDILQQHDARGTFFLVGSKAEKHPYLVKNLVDAGHQIGNHTFSHPDDWRVPKSRLIDEM